MTGYYLHADYFESVYAALRRLADGGSCDLSIVEDAISLIDELRAKTDDLTRQLDEFKQRAEVLRELAIGMAEYNAHGDEDK